MTAGTASQAWVLNASLPTELQTWHPFTDSTDVLDGATMTYFTAWSASLSTPQYAYLGEAIVHKGAGTGPGFYKVRFGGYVANASVSTTPVPKLLSKHVTDRVEGAAGLPFGGWFDYNDMPAELQAQRFFPTSATPIPPSGAWITYNAQWNAAATTPQFAYTWRCSVQAPSDLTASLGAVYEMYGVAYVVNASVSLTPVIRIVSATYTPGTAAKGGAGISIYSAITSGEVASILEDTVGNGAWIARNNGGVITLEGNANQYLDSGHTINGGSMLAWTASGGNTVNAIAQFPIITPTRNF